MDALPHEKVMAVARDVGIGVRDTGMPVLWFTAYTSECSASLQVISDWAEVGRIIESTGAYDAHDLNGKPCWVEQDNGIVRFVSFWRK